MQAESKIRHSKTARGVLALAAGLLLVKATLAKQVPDPVVVVNNLERREALVTDGAGLVSPAAAAFPASQFVVSVGVIVIVRHWLLAFPPFFVNGSE